MERCAIYLRVSTKEQNEELQRDDCLAYCRNHDLEVVGVFQERVSAFKENIIRPERDKIIDLAHRGEIKHIIVWAFDRWIRRRDTLIEDVETIVNLGCKMHAIKDIWYEAINIDGPLGKTIKEFMLGIIGSLAEMESQRKSERIWLGKQSTTKHQGPNFKVDKNEKKEIIELYNNLKSYRKVAREYNIIHKPHIRYGTVAKIINENKKIDVEL